MLTIVFLMTFFRSLFFISEKRVLLSTNDYSVKSTLGCLESRVISLGVGMSKLRSGAGVTFFVVFEIKELLLNTSKPTLSFTLLLKFHPLLSMIAS